MINWENLEKELETFKGNQPYDYCIVKDFFDLEHAKKLEHEFPDFYSDEWYVYNNAIEDKKALNNWNLFPEYTYNTFLELNSPKMLKLLGKHLNKMMHADQGLHGGGWHIHGPGGNLNPHLDYSIHPKMKMQRKVNIIIYLSQDLKEEHGGHLGLWDHDDVNGGQPGKLINEVQPKFNTAIIFDTTQNSWHGMSRDLTQPKGIYRKSLACYYLCEPSEDAADRGRALFAPREEQKGDGTIEALIQKRSDVSKSVDVYVDKD